MRQTARLAASLLLVLSPAPLLADEPADPGVLPVGADGKALNLDFETGTLRDWTAEGNAFDGQPIQGDTVALRRPDMKSDHQGKFWVGTFERGQDAPRGTLTSVPFQVTHPWATFLIGGGSFPETAVELVREDTDKPFFRTTGDVSENLKPVLVDLHDHLGKSIFIRVIDDHSGGWGHINFDNFRFHDEKPEVAARNVPTSLDVYSHAGLSPEEAAKAMTLPEGFRVELVAGEPDVVQPIALALDDRGRVWVAEAYSYPHKLPEDQARDRILIFEDTNNDGRFDRRTVFADHLNLVSGLQVGFGGVWVGAAPELLFIPDKNGDDVPDGPPQVLLDGWAMQDTHETLNSFTWGPDGWLYGCHGVFTFSNVGKPGTPDDQRTPINAGVWRYHPRKQIFEVFAEGTSNPWGIDFDGNGQCFITACVIPHLYHMIEGGRYQRQAGQPFNPYTYGEIQNIGDHVHYVGANPHSGNGRSDAAGGGHAHSGALIYLGHTWPEEYRGSLFMNNIHGARLNRDILTPLGSGFVGSHAPDFLLANDAWSQIVSLRLGPDGNMYMIDWYDKNQCHRNEAEMHDRTNGRIFKVSYGKPAAGPPQDIGKLDDDQLVQAIGSPNEFRSLHALRLVHERGLSEPARARLARLAFSPPVDPEAETEATVQMTRRHQLRALQALHLTGGLSPDHITRGLANLNPYIRAWTIQLACEDRNPSDATLEQMVKLAKSDPSPVVRLYLASALGRLPLERRWETLANLVAHGEDADDHNLPLMYWYAAEPLAAVDASRALSLAESSPIPILASYMTRRVAALGTPEAMTLIVERIGQAKDSAARLTLLRAVNEALQGRREVARPDAWPAVFAALLKDPSADTRTQAIALGTTFGDAAAMDALRAALTDAKVPVERRQEALAALLKARDPKLPAVLRGFLKGADLRSAAIRGLAAFDDPATPAAILEVYPKLEPTQRRDALGTLASRPAYARALLDAVESKKVDSKDLTADLIRDLRNLKDDALNARIAEVWGMARDTPAAKAKLIEQYRDLVRRGYQNAPDPTLGRAVFTKTCGQCHTLFGTGGDIGPDLTGSNRADLDYVLSNVIDPSALVGKDYQATVLAVNDGRILTGIVKSEDKDAITLATATETVVVPKPDVEERQLTDQSLMPEDQWLNLSDFEVRSLVAYLASPGQVPMLANDENAATFFNGRDLKGWQGDPALWSVVDGEIVGKTDGLDHNEFLRGDLTAGDFHLTAQVKLVANEGNSGIQFRSEALPDGEMKGYQADIGAGWWGKLYEENGRALLWDKSGEEFVKPGDWNSYEILAVGGHIRTWINGHLCVDLNDPDGAKLGIFALQLHSGGPTEVRYKDLKLELNPSDNRPALK